MRIATLNIRGLRKKKKMKAVVNFLNKSNLDIIALQETHLLSKDYEHLKEFWNGPVLFSEGTNLSKELCIMFGKYFSSENISIIFSNERI